MKYKLVELECVKLARYIIALMLSIQDEPSLTSPIIVNQCYQLSLKVEENFKRRNEQSGKGKGKSDTGNPLVQKPMLLEPPQKKALFKENCKSLHKVCKVVIDSSSTKNLMSKEMVDKLKLEKIPHPNSSHVSWLTK